jgi:hypothetical protein
MTALGFLNALGNVLCGAASACRLAGDRQRLHLEKPMEPAAPAGVGTRKMRRKTAMSGTRRAGAGGCGRS